MYMDRGLPQSQTFRIVVEGVQILKDGQEIQPITREQQKAKYDQALKDQHDGNLQTAFN